MDQSFSERLKELCGNYYNEYEDVPPCPVSSYTRMNSLLAGTRKPTLDELVKISEAYVTGDELFPSLHGIKKKEVESILRTIENLK